MREAAPAVADPIEHVVVLCLENRSFDQMLGGLQAVYPSIDGVDPAVPPRENFDDEHREPYWQVPTQTMVVDPDPKHEWDNVEFQLGNHNDYFVLDYARTYRTTTREQRQLVMSYYATGTLPALHALARTFTVCDHWHASVPGPTWPNRLFLMSGTSLGRVRMPDGILRPNLHWYDQDSIFDRLSARQIDWRVYAGDFPLSLLLVNQWKPNRLARLKNMDDFWTDAAGAAEHFPAFAFIEPDYLGEDANDDHPPHDAMDGERLVASVYNAIRSNPALWRSTLLVVLFDEHGGFYDHAVPPAAVAPDTHTDDGFDFQSLGVRVPALLVSPWVENRVESTLFDHTSLLKYLTDKWGLDPLYKRAAQANSIAPCLSKLTTPRLDILPRIDVPPRLRAVPPAARPLTSQEQAIELWMQFLETHPTIPPEGTVHRVMHAMAYAPKVRADVRDRLNAFLAGQRDDT
jgi:phospholipase C